MRLHDLAHARTGDKGDLIQIAVFPYGREHYPLLCQQLTAAAVCAYLGLPARDARRYEVPGLPALNFVIARGPGADVTRSLALDPHGKCQSGILLDMPIEAVVSADARS